MLRRLSIRDLAVVDAIDLEFGPGLCALTGETGAGKSILVDGLGLALGRRAASGLVRPGAPRAASAAEFSLRGDSPAAAWIAERGLARDDDAESAILRREVGADGRSRAFVNDRPTTAAALADLGGLLIEIHGQDGRLGLLDPARHRAALDAFGGLEDAARAVADGHERRRAREIALAEAAARLERDAADREWLQAQIEELGALAPDAGEDARLDAERRALMAGERIEEALGAAAAALANEPERPLAAAARAVRDAAPQAAGRLDELAAALDRALVETGEARACLDAATADTETDRGRLESVEGRLFALRAAARKHRCEADGLPEVAASLTRRLDAIRDGERGLDALRAAAAEARTHYERAAESLGEGRRCAARALGEKVSGELAALRLGAARFSVEVTSLGAAAGAHGAERVGFRVATGAGGEGGALQRIASGGELSRFMLALCVVLADRHAVPSLIFDEIDAGVGGAVAHAVGARLARLAARAQVLVVTHHPQVAALATHHCRIVKRSVRGRATTSAEALPPEARREEIARMLSGAKITGAARAAADSLLAGAATPR